MATSRSLFLVCVGLRNLSFVILCYASTSGVGPHVLNDKAAGRAWMPVIVILQICAVIIITTLRLKSEMAY